jgi:putative membrane protein
MIPPEVSISGLRGSGNAFAGQPYCGQIDPGAQWYLQFNLDPAVIGLLTLAALWASVAHSGLRQVRLAGLVIAAILWISPLCPLSASLLSARVIHHLAVMFVLAPVLALAWPFGKTPPSTQRPSLWGVASAASFAVWFWPPAYTAAWQHDAIYWAMQLVMLGATVMFWRVLLQLADQGAALASVPALAIGSAAMGAVGAVLTFAPRVLLAEHQASALALGVSPLGDQQLAGLIVWLFGMVPLAGFAFYAAWRTLARSGEAAA